ncbi:MAG: 5-oxoprolinase subunit PxpB [Proteobacteria bacterium]|nr:5-oxoprolinase subunit PxpB [Pseudomonadota bacterium]
MDDTYPEIKVVAEGSLLIEYEEEVSLRVNLKARRLAFGLEQGSYPGLEEIIPTYRSVMVYFDPFRVDVGTVRRFIEEINTNLVKIVLPPPKLFRIPTTYGGIHGPDLDRVAEHIGLTPDEVVELFSTQAYPVYFLGFICSLAYLGGVPKTLHVPRLSSPRPSVPGGSVGFAGPQANILPVDSPSGFNYIGRTFVAVYDPHEFPPTLIRPGDYIRCPAVSEKEARLAGKKPLGEFVGSFQSN